MLLNYQTGVGRVESSETRLNIYLYYFHYLQMLLVCSLMLAKQHAVGLSKQFFVVQPHLQLNRMLMRGGSGPYKQNKKMKMGRDEDVYRSWIMLLGFCFILVPFVQVYMGVESHVE